MCGMSNYKYPELPSDPYDVDVWIADPLTAELAEEVWLMGSGVGRS